jgi:peptide/nickel transport system substrate-binding protein
MKKVLLISFVIIIAGILVLSGCGGTTTTSPPSTMSSSSTPPTSTTSSAKPPPSTTASSPTQTSTTVAPPSGVVTGGILKMITDAGGIPKNLGYGPEKAPVDDYLMKAVMERLCEWDPKGNQIPVLAESWEGDPQALTVTWHLRKGVKFTDGTDWNAEALLWNFQLGLDNNRLTDGQYVQSLEVKDDYTLVMHVTKFNWLMFENYGWASSISPAAFVKGGGGDFAKAQAWARQNGNKYTVADFVAAGGGDLEKSKSWARANAVGTGPFTVSEFQRDVVIKFTKNPNYWRTGMPYLDGIELRYIPDPMVASAMIEAGEADMWSDVSAVPNIVDLQKKGFKINWGPGMFNAILFDSANPDSVYSNKLVREAVEYALDRPALAQMLGQGLYEPLHEMASETWPGYVEGYDPRPFNPDKARELLAEAGYPKGFKTTMLTSDSAAARDAVAAMQAYLGDVGIEVTPDVADLGRYMGSMFVSGYKDMSFALSGINPDATDLFIHFGPSPMTFRTGNMYKSPEFLALCDQALNPQYQNAEQAMPKIKEAIKQAGEDAMIVPLWRTCNVAIMQPYVHSDYFLIHGVIWTPWDDWMDKH